MGPTPANPSCNCDACAWTIRYYAKLELADPASNVLKRAIHATETHLQNTGSSQRQDVLSTNFEQKTAHDGDGIYQFLYRIFALPAEMRELVWRFACGGDLTIRVAGSSVAGSEANGIISAMLALKDPQLRSEGLMGVWKSFPIEWEGSIDDNRVWRRFKSTVIPHIRCLTINFSLSNADVFHYGSEIMDTIAWMEIRGRPDNRARYPWNLEQLHLIGRRSPMSRVMDGSGWYFWSHCPVPGCKHWSEHWALKALVRDGLKVTVDTKYDNRPTQYWAWTG